MSSSRPNKINYDTGVDKSERLARLVADAEIEWPEGLSDPESAELTHTVRVMLRGRLIRLIANAIAADLAAPDKDEANAADQF